MRVLCDACVLYPPGLRAIIHGAAQAGLLVPLWSDRIMGEWLRAAARNGIDARAEAAAFAAAFAPGHVMADGAEAPFLPDPDDRHVLAAAIAGQADVLLTFNIRDFPRRTLAAHGLTARHPDGFLWELHSHAPATMARIIDTARRGTGEQAPAMRPFLRRLHLPRLSRALQGDRT